MDEDLLVGELAYADGRMPNMYCRVCHNEFFWKKWLDDRAKLPICPFHSIERNTLDWIGT